MLIDKLKRFFILTIAVCFIVVVASPVIAQIKDTSIIQTQDNNLQLVARAKKLYQLGRFPGAVEIWQQASDGFAAVGDKANQAMSLSNLSLTYQKLGQWNAAREAITKSINLLQSSSEENQLRILAQSLSIQGKLQLTTGDANSALQTWQQAAKIYSQVSDNTGKIQSQINQAQAYQTLGFYPRAIAILKEVNEILQTQPDSAVKVRFLLNLGNVLNISGDLQQAQENLQQSLKIADSLQLTEYQNRIYLSLGNLARSQKKFQEAINYYKQAANSASVNVQVQARLNHLNILIKTQQWQLAKAMWTPILEQLNNLPPSSSNINAKINLAQSLICLKQPNLTQEELNSPVTQKCIISNSNQQITSIKKKNLKNTIQNSNVPKWSEIDKLLVTAKEQAQNLQDKRAEAYALGYRGAIYQQKQNLSEADNFTRQALNLAIDVKASDIAYLWHWQLGRIAKSRNELQTAISTYTDAFKNLQSLRGDLVATLPDIQFSFRESVEPVYRELVDLLLKEKQPNLKLARQVIESLQLAELDDFFREACVDAQPKQIDKIVEQANPPTAAVVYAFFLDNSLEVILKLPGEDLAHYSTPLQKNLAQKTLKQLQQAFPQIDKTKEVRDLSKEVYSWLITPIENKLKSNKIETLVFVLDGALRNIPMGVLYDGQSYLVQKYAIALTPGLQLLNPRPFTNIELNAITAGISKEINIEGQGFNQLEFVESELQKINSQIKDSKKLLNEQFTRKNLQRQINRENYSVVHLATHGQFSSDPEKTFLLMWDNLLKARELNNLLRTTDTNQNQQQPIELLVLSACETASGDERAALGLAGIAIRAGARSTVATLWNVNDESTSLFMKQFYQELTNPNITKVQALQNAQKALLNEKSQPYFWAPYTLVGNWL